MNKKQGMWAMLVIVSLIMFSLYDFWPISKWYFATLGFLILTGIGMCMVAGILIFIMGIYNTLED